MKNHKVAVAVMGFSLACGTVCGQQAKALTNDPPTDSKAPTQNVETVIESDGSKLFGIFLLASGAAPHWTAILLHGFPGYEQNMDLAQTLRRDGWNVWQCTIEEPGVLRVTLVLRIACRM